MKKILLSLLMLCTAVSAWSYDTETVTKTSQQSKNGIITCDEFMIVGNLDKTTGAWTKGLAVYSIHPGCVITSVEFVMRSGSINQCECNNGSESGNGNWKADAAGKWEQDGTFAYDANIAFTSSSSCLIDKVTITYHKHTLAKNTDFKAATCTETGMMGSWKCSDCGHTYYDEKGAGEVAKDENLLLSIDPTNHNGKLTEVAGKNASVIEEGVLHHWHCEACGKDYADAGGNTDITGKTVKAKYDADAILIGMNEGKIIDDSFMLLPSEEETVTVATVTFEEDDTIILDIAGKGGEKTAYSINETNPLEISFAHTFKLKANQDPDHTDRYYSTFFTGEGAYKVPNTATAYTGTVEDGEEEGIDFLSLSAVEGVIPCGEAVIVRGSEKNITLMPSCKKLTPSTGNILEGTDEATTLGADQYALSLGQHGVGFYLWDGKTIGANKAYLTIDEALGVKSLLFRFNDEPGTTGIKAPSSSPKGESPATYDLKGMLVNDGYKGIVIKNGKKAILR